ncbi:MAG: rhomboid family intramembrane serine protease [Frankiaceae bacterium]|jgi:membrane associated rhomboid family serine protease|nr:rhomboid family intramembrane serine protease [Frankiaceae bacterium]
MSGPAQSGPLGPNGLPYCYRHPMRETGVRCIRCDRPICSDCMHPGAVGFQCPDDVRAGRIVTRTVVGAPARTRRAPVVTAALAGANVAIYLVTVLQSGKINSLSSSRLFQDWVLVPYVAAHGQGSSGAQPYRLLTSAFLHLSMPHLLLNMLALAMLGMSLEPVLGWWRYLCVYLIAALGAGTCVYLFDSPFSAVAGASGGIYGLFAAALVLGWRAGFDMRSLLVVIALNFALTFSLAGISKLGHIGGFLAGGLAAVAIAGLALPGRSAPKRFPLPIQAGGLVVIVVALLAAIVVRTSGM